MNESIAILGTLDTKGEEFAFLRDQLQRRGHKTVVIDLGVMGEPSFEPDISREHVVSLGGASLDEFKNGNMRGKAIDTVIAGGKRLVRELYTSGHLDGVICMGGGSGTTIGLQIMSELPMGVPKVQVTTLTDLTRFIGNCDVCVVRSMVDLVGLNSVTRTIIQEAAGAISGMVTNKPEMRKVGKCIAITCLGVTTPGVMKIRQRLHELGKEVLVLHRRTDVVDMLVREDLLECMMDLTPSELQRGWLFPHGKPNMNRILTVREKGIPLIMAPGALDMLLQPSPVSELPDEFRERRNIVHSPNMTLLAATNEEYRMQAEYCQKILKLCKGPAYMIVPTKGFSMWSTEDKAFYNPDAVSDFINILQSGSKTNYRVRCIDAGFNDDAFADAIIGTYKQIMKGDL